MEYKTYSDFRTKIGNDLILDLDDATGFVTDAELVDYVNEALDDAESIIHTLGLEAVYFRVIESPRMSLVSGTQDYDLPSDIYANKLLRVFYISGNKKYRIDRVRNPDMNLDIESGQDFRYLIVNGSTAPQMRFYPTPAANESAVIERWYIRNVRTVTTSLAASNTLEIPECHNFLYQHVKTRIYEKEGNPLLSQANRWLIEQRKMLHDTLREMVPDEDNEIIPDLSHYEESATEILF